MESGIQKLSSLAVSRRASAACGANLVPCIMELGGKAPLMRALFSRGGLVKRIRKLF